MNKDSFDKALKHKLSDSATDFDQEAAWTALELRRRKQPKRRGPVWWFLAGFALLLGGSAAWWWSVQPVPKQATSDVRVVSGDRSLSDDRGSSGDRKGRPYGASQIHETQASANDILPTKDNRITTPNHKTPDIDNARSSAGATLAGAREMDSSDLVVRDMDKRGFSGNRIPSGDRDIDNRNMDNHQMDDRIASGDREGRPYGTSRVGDMQFATVPEGRTLVATALFQLPGIQPGFIKIPRPEISSKQVVQPPPAEKRRRRTEPKWSVGAHAVFGLNKVDRTGLADYTAARAQEEETLDMFQGGLDIRRQLSRRLFIQTGIQYVQWTDVRHSVQTTESIRPDSNILLERIIYPDGSIENVFGPGEVRVVRTTRETSYNRYRHIELPVMAGLALPVGSHWQLEAAAGLAIGLVSRHSGSAAIGNATLSLDALPYRNAGTLTATGSLAWMYRQSNWSAGLALTGRTGLNSSSQDVDLFSEKRRSVGLGLVVRRVIR